MNPAKFFAIVALTLGTCAFAQDYPTRPVTVVVPTPPGGSTDVVGRALAEEMGKQMGGKTFVVENRPGASGMLGTQAVARANPDGYTLLFAHALPIYFASHVFSKVPYDVRRDFAFVTQICNASLVIGINSEIPARTMQEFIAWAGANKGKVTYGSFGAGSPGHIASAYLSETRGLQMSHVPYKDEAPMIQDIANGSVQWGIGTAGAMGPMVKSGRLRLLAVFGTSRLETLPDVPTMAQAGLTEPEFRPMSSMMVMAPAGTPAPVLARLEAQARAATRTAAMKARFQAYGCSPVASSSEQFRKDFEAMSPVIERLVKVTGVRAD